MDYTIVLFFLLSLTVLILASVALGSVNKASMSDDDKKNAQRSNTGILTISVVLTLIASWFLYNELKASGLIGKKTVMYYF